MKSKHQNQKTRTERRSHRAGRSAAVLIAAAGVLLGGGVISAGAAHASAESVDRSDPQTVEALLKAREAALREAIWAGAGGAGSAWTGSDGSISGGSNKPPAGDPLSPRQ